MSLSLFSQVSPGIAVTADQTAYTLGVQFSVNQAATLNGMWFFSPSGGAVDLPQTIALYQVSGTSLITSNAATWSGALGSGWVFAAFTSPPVLTASTAYKGVVLQNQAQNWYASTAHYWDTGAGSAGITNGALSAPNNAGASVGQDVFNAGAVLTYPASTFNSTNYWVDVDVTVNTTSAGNELAEGTHMRMSTIITLIVGQEEEEDYW